MNEKIIPLLLERFRTKGDWYEALLYAALNKTHDINKAILLADKGYVDSKKTFKLAKFDEEEAVTTVPNNPVDTISVPNNPVDTPASTANDVVAPVKPNKEVPKRKDSDVDWTAEINNTFGDIDNIQGTDEYKANLKKMIENTINSNLTLAQKKKNLKVFKTSDASRIAMWASKLEKKQAQTAANREEHNFTKIHLVDDFKKRLATGETVEKIIDKEGEDIGPIHIMSMSKPEKMKGIKLQNLEISWSDEVKGLASSVVESIANGMFPIKLAEAPVKVVFSSQQAKNEDRAADAQGGTICFYGITTKGVEHPMYITGEHGGRIEDLETDKDEAMKLAPVSIYAHEAGHTLATKLWGTSTPPKTSAYGKLQDKYTAKKGEGPVTAYAMHGGSAEDFAEACRLYVQHRAKFEKYFPKKYAALKELLGEK